MKQIPKIIVGCIPDQEYLSPEFKLDVNSDSDGVFIYETSNPSVFTVNQDGIVTITGPGQAYIIIQQLETNDFYSGQIDRLITVNKSEPPIFISGPLKLIIGESNDTLKIESIENIIDNVFCINENIEVSKITEYEYQLIPKLSGKSSIIVRTKNNYYFKTVTRRLDLEVFNNFNETFLLNINTFNSGFKHDALKEIDILTSQNNNLDNNIQINFQQESRGWTFDVPILNINSQNFINDIYNYNREILCCPLDKYLEYTVEWNFKNNIVYNFFPYEGNTNDIPRINIFRSDGQYIDYVSGGFNLLKIPPNSNKDDPNAFTYQKWGDRNTGIKTLRVPDIKCLLNNSFIFSDSSNFWDFTENPANKTLSNFRVNYSNGSVFVKWSDENNPEYIIPNNNYSHTFKNIFIPDLYYGVELITREDLLPNYLDPPLNFWDVSVSSSGIIYKYYFLEEDINKVTIKFPGFILPPTNVSINNIQDTSFNVTWDSVAGATQYYIDVSETINFSSKVDNYDNRPVFQTNVNVININPGTTYYIRVRASNPDALSLNSQTVAVITLPSRVVNLIATNIQTNNFTINWNQNIGATSYRLDVSTVSNFATRLAGYDGLTVNSTSQSITGLTAGTTYYVRVRAVNSNGLESANSSTFTQSTVPVAPNAPTISNVTAATFTAAWNSVTGASEYRIDVATTSDFTGGFVTNYNDRVVSETSVSVIGLSPITTYYVRVRAVNTLTANTVTSINSPTATQITLPLAPTGLTATLITTTSFTANWNSVNEATSYRLDVSTVADFATRLLGYDDLTVNGTSQSITGLTAGTTYYVRVRAVDSNGLESANSSTLTQITAPAAPNAPTISSVTAATFTATWNSVTGASEYRIDVATRSDFTSGFVTNYNDRPVFGTNVSVIGLNSGTAYYVRIRAVNTLTANTVTSTNSPTATQITLPLAPTGLTATLITTTSFTANWNSVNEATSYRLDVSTVADFATRLLGYDDLTVNGTSQSITGLTAGTTYYVRVRAVDSNGLESANSSTLTQITAPAAPNAPTISSVTAATFTATWDSITGASAYRIDVATSSDFTSGFVTNYNDRPVYGTSVSVIGLSSNTNYYVRVRFVNYIETSQNSPISTVVTAPLAPIITISNIDFTKFLVSWASVAGAINYRLDVSTNDTFSTYVTGYQNIIINGTSELILALNEGTTYYVRVRAVGINATSSNSLLATVLTKLAPVYQEINSLVSIEGFGGNIITNDDASIFMCGGGEMRRDYYMGNQEFNLQNAGAMLLYSGNLNTNANQFIAGFEEEIPSSTLFPEIFAERRFGGYASINKDATVIAIATNTSNNSYYLYTRSNNSNSWIRNQNVYLGINSDVSINRDGTEFLFAGRIYTGNANTTDWAYDSEFGITTSSKIVRNRNNTIIIFEDYGNLKIYNSANKQLIQSIPRYSQQGSDPSKFGSSIAVNDDASVIAVADLNFEVNEVYIYTGSINTQWNYSTTLSRPSSLGNNYTSFGLGLAINGSGDIIAVGQPGLRSYDGKYRGVVNLYYNNNDDDYSWTPYAQISRGGTTDSYFSYGSHVAMSKDGSILFVGQPNGDGTDVQLATIGIVSIYSGATI